MSYKLKPELLLKFGLGAVFIYAGASSLISPNLWLGYVPIWIESIINPETVILIHGIAQTLIGALLLLNYFIREVSFIAFLDLLSIIVFFGIDPVTFRDFGLLMAALALYVISSEKKPKS